MRAEGKAACRLSGCFMRSPTSSVKMINLDYSRRQVTCSAEEVEA